MNQPNANIRVEFLDAASGQPFSVSEVPLEELPDVFDTDSEITIGEQRWEIVEARPALKPEFARAGRVELTLRRIDVIDPGEVLFSLPTLNPDTPKPGDKEASGGERVIVHEDDWRQVEFVSMSHLSGIHSELSAIETIYRNERHGGGFRQCHLREEIGAPLYDSLLQLKKVKKALGCRKSLKGVSYPGDRRLIEGSFAFETDLGFSVFGQKGAKALLSLCCPATPRPGSIPDAARRLARFTESCNLVYVDWCWMAAIRGDEAEFRAHFSRALDAD